VAVALAPAAGQAQQPDRSPPSGEAVRSADGTPVQSLLPDEQRRAPRRAARASRSGPTVGPGASPVLTRAADFGGVDVVEARRGVNRTPWPRDDINFPPSFTARPAGDVNGDGAADWVYVAANVPDDRTADRSARTAKTFLRFGGGDPSAELYDELYYRNLQPAGNVVGDSLADAIEVTDSDIRVYAGTADGYTEQPVGEVSLPPGTVSTEPVDLNGDGYDDVVLTGQYANRIIAVFGAENGSDLRVEGLKENDAQPRGVYFGHATGNVDRDSLGEVIQIRSTFESDTSTVSVYETVPGPDTLALQQRFVSEGFGGRVNRSTIQAVNVDSTELAEIVVTGQAVGEGTAIHTTRPDTAAYSSEVVRYSARQVRAGDDVNGDGRPDLIFSGRGENGVRSHTIAFSPPNVRDGIQGTVRVPQDEASERVYTPVFVGDATGDGRANLVARLRTESTVGQRFLTVDGGQAEASDVTLDQAPYRSPNVHSTERVVDWNGDGNDDYAVATRRTEVNIQADEVEVFDDRGRVQVFVGDPAEGASAEVTFTHPDGAIPTSMAAGDFTGNGEANLAVAWEDDEQNVAVYEAGAGDEPIHTVALTDLGVNPDSDSSGIGFSASNSSNSKVANLGDVNGDGVDDLGVTLPEIESRPGQAAYVFLGGSNLSARPDVTADFGDDAASSRLGTALSGVGDVNGDGIEDFAVGDVQSGRGAVFVAFGEEGAASGLDFSTPDVVLRPQVGEGERVTFFPWGGIVSGDFNADGVPDIAAKSAFFRNENQQGLEAIRIYHGGADFDAEADRALRLPAGPLNAQGFSFLSTGPYLQQSFGELTAVPDLDGDGADELLVGSGNPSNALLFSGNGAEAPVATTALRAPDQNKGLGFGTVFTNRPHESSAVGDFDGDRRLDLVLPHTGGSFSSSGTSVGTPAYAYEIDRGRLPTATAEAAVTDTSETASVDFSDEDVATTGLTFDGPQGSGTASVQQFSSPPSGSDGVAEENVSDYRFIVDVSGEFGFDRATIRFAADSLRGVEDPTDLQVYRRSVAGEGDFSPVDSVGYDAEADEVVAVTDRLSEFAFASNTNPLPVEMAGFEAQTAGEGAVRLSWQTASERGNAGFAVQRKAFTGEGLASWTKVGFVDSKAEGGTSTEALRYRFVDEGVPFAADSARYRLRQVDVDGSASATDPVTVTRQVDRLRLLGTAPNPARTEARLRFAVPGRTEVTVRLYDVLGRRVQTVRRGEAEGRVETRVDVSGLASGVYFLRLRAGEATETRRLTVVK
jgi:hypothetical protein